MQRITTATAAADLFGAGKPGFTDGDPQAGIASTFLNAAWFNHVQEELANVVEATGLVLNGARRDQLLEAIRRLSLLSGRADIPVLGWQSAPPAASAVGDVYAVGPAPTGAWNGQANKLAVWLGAWSFVTPLAGILVNFVQAGRLVILWHDGAAWKPYGALANYQGYAEAGAFLWQVPQGVNFIDLEVCGAGGGGAGANGTRVTSGAGGGAGGSAFSVLPVTPGDQIQITVGAGGTAGAAANSSDANATRGGLGGSTTVNNPGKWTATCAGGQAGADTQPGSGGSGTGTNFGGYGISGGYGAPGRQLASGAGAEPYAYGGQGASGFFGGGGASIYLNPASGGRRALAAVAA